jgi:hypothetical protein
MCRDATFLASDFPVTLLDCLMSLEKAQQLGWYNHATFGVEDYEYWDHPLNGDLHQVMPCMEEVGKFVAFKGPSSTRSLSRCTICVCVFCAPASSCAHACSPWTMVSMCLCVHVSQIHSPLLAAGPAPSFVWYFLADMLHTQTERRLRRVYTPSRQRTMLMFSRIRA